MKIYLARQCLAEYPLPPYGVKNELFSPPGQPQPRYKPNNRKRPAHEEEKRLRAMGSTVSQYLDFALKAKGIRKHQFLRRLLTLSRSMNPDLFCRTVQRALRFQVLSLDILRNIARLNLTTEDTPLPMAEIDESFLRREAYLDGRLTETPDFSDYRDIEEPPDDKGTTQEEPSDDT